MLVFSMDQLVFIMYMYNVCVDIVMFITFSSSLSQGKLQRFLYNLPKEMIKRLHR